MASQQLILEPLTAVNLLTEFTVDLVDGTAYLLQNKGVGNVEIAEASVSPSPGEAASFAIRPLEIWRFTADSGAPLYGWALAISCLVSVNEA